MKLLSKLLSYSRGTMILATLAGIAAGAASAGLLVLINFVLHQSLQPAKAIWLFFGMSLVVPLTSIGSTYLLVKLGQEAIVDLRLDLCRRILRTPLSRLEEIGAHRLLAALTEDVMAITQAVALIPLLCMNAALLAGCLIYLGLLSWKLLLCLLILIVFGAVTYQLPMIGGGNRMRQFREVADSLFGHFRAITGGVKELKLHRQRREEFLAAVEKSSSQLKDLGVSSLTLFSLAASWGQFLLFVVLGILLFASSSLGIANRQLLDGFILTILFMVGPLQGILGQMPQIGRANIALQKIERLGLALSDRDLEAVAAGAAPAGWKRLELRGVTHAYKRPQQEEVFTLGPIDLALSQGELVFITGGNGSGKTTLAKVLAGLYPPETGEILVDGERVDDASREAYRQQFAAVFSDFYLFDALLGQSREGLDARAGEILRQLQIDDKVRVNAGRFSTTDLSQGQRKRLALLTAFLEDRPIYLFDEWAADQDPHFKEIFYHQLLPELKALGKCVCVISHDDRYYDVADRVVKLENGKIVSEGPSRLGLQPVEMAR